MADTRNSNDTSLRKKRGKIVLQGRTITRRKKLHDIILTEGITSVSILSQRLKISEETIRQDVYYIMEDNEFWLDAMVRRVWVAECREQFTQTMQEIKDINDYIKKKMADPENPLTDVGMAQLQNAITKKREFVQQFLKDLPFYHKMKKLADWVKEHQKPEVSAPDIPQMQIYVN